MILFIICILLFSLFWRAEYCAYKYGDTPKWIREDTVSLILTILMTFLIFALVSITGEMLDCFDRKRVLFVVMLLSAAVQVTFILLFPAKQFADQDTVNYIAYRLLKGEYEAFQKGYLYKYPNNVGITLFLTLIYRIFPKTLLVPKLLNVVFSSVTSYLTFRTYEELSPSKMEDPKETPYGVLLISGFFLPMILLNNLVYNDIIATTFFTGLVYCTVRYGKTRKPVYLFKAGLLTVMGNFFRQLGVVFLIAVTLYLIIKKINVVKAFAFLVITLILCQLPMTIVNAFLIHNGKITEPIGKNSIPIHMWLNIGMNKKKMGYWDSSESYNVYIREGKWNKAESAAIYTELMKDKLKGRGYLNVLKVYAKKNLWLWTEGTYQAEYYGIGSWGYLYPTRFTRHFQDQRLRDHIRWVLHATNLLMLGLALTGLINSAVRKYDYPFLLPAIVLLGFIGFYTLWEIKPRYIYLTYPYLILMSYHGLALVCRKFKNFINGI